MNLRPWCRCHRLSLCGHSSFSNAVILCIPEARLVPPLIGASVRPVAECCVSAPTSHQEESQHRRPKEPSGRDGLARNLSRRRQASCGRRGRQLVCPNACVAALSLGAGVESRGTSVVSWAERAFADLCRTNLLWKCVTTDFRFGFPRFTRGRRRGSTQRILACGCGLIKEVVVTHFSKNIHFRKRRPRKNPSAVAANTPIAGYFLTKFSPVSSSSPTEPSCKSSSDSAAFLFAASYSSRAFRKSSRAASSRVSAASKSSSSAAGAELRDRVADPGIFFLANFNAS